MSHLGDRLSALVDGELGPAERDLPTLTWLAVSSAGLKQLNCVR